MFLNDDTDDRFSSKEALVAIYRELKQLQKRIDQWEQTLDEQEFRRQNPPTFITRTNAVVLPNIREFGVMLFPLTGFFGFHHYYYTDDFSLALMYCVFPVVFWMVDLLAFFVHKQHHVWKHIRIGYTLLFYFLGIVYYFAMTDLKKKLPPPELCSLFALFITNAIGFKTLFYSTLMFGMFPRSEYFSLIVFMFAYYCEQTQETTKLNEIGIWKKRFLYGCAFIWSLGFYKVALLDKDVHAKIHQFFDEINALFSYTLKQTNTEIKHNLVELKKDLFI